MKSNNKLVTVDLSDSPQIYTLGQSIPFFTAISLLQLITWLKSLQFFVFDWDGCLAEGGLETANNPRTVLQYFAENERTVKYFRSLVLFFAKLGIQFGICTGRSADFIIPHLDKLFPKGKIAFLICEGGADLYLYDPKQRKFVQHKPDYVSAIDVQWFMERKEKIREVCENLGAVLESGKKVILSFNTPPEWKNNIEGFYELVYANLNREFGLDIRQYMSYEHSGTAIDCGPKLANKVLSMKEIVKDNLTAYVGDAMNDAGAMIECLINLLPKNSSSDIQRIAKQVMCCLVSQKSELPGTTDLLNKLQLALSFEKNLRIDVKQNPKDKVYFLK